MTLNSSSVLRPFYLSPVPGVRYKEGIPKGHCQKQWKFLNRKSPSAVELTNMICRLPIYKTHLLTTSKN